MAIKKNEKDIVKNIELENGSVTIYFTNGDPKGKTYSHSLLSLSEKLFIVDFFKQQFKKGENYG